MINRVKNYLKKYTYSEQEKPRNMLICLHLSYLTLGNRPTTFHRKRNLYTIPLYSAYCRHPTRKINIRTDSNCTSLKIAPPLTNIVK